MAKSPLAILPSVTPMRPIRDHEIRHARAIADNSSPDPLLQTLLELLAVPVAFLLALLAFPLVLHLPVPVWAAVGLGLYGGLSVWAGVEEVRLRDG